MSAGAGQALLGYINDTIGLSKSEMPWMLGLNSSSDVCVRAGGEVTTDAFPTAFLGGCVVEWFLWTCHTGDDSELDEVIFDGRPRDDAPGFGRIVRFSSY